MFNRQSSNNSDLIIPYFNAILVQLIFTFADSFEKGEFKLPEIKPDSWKISAVKSSFSYLNYKRCDVLNFKRSVLKYANNEYVLSSILNHFITYVSYYIFSSIIYDEFNVKNYVIHDFFLFYMKAISKQTSFYEYCNHVFRNKYVGFSDLKYYVKCKNATQFKFAYLLRKTFKFHKNCRIIISDPRLQMSIF